MVASNPKGLLLKPVSVLYILMLAVFLPVACQRKGAQVPANKIQAVDSTEMKLRDYNREVTRKEDSAILEFIGSQPDKFTKTASGIWFCLLQSSGLEPLATGSDVTFSYRAFTMDGILVLEEGNKTIRFGKKEVVTGLEEGLKLMKRGEKARFIVPWYLAYGARGNEMIGPCTTLIFVAEVQK